MFTQKNWKQKKPAALKKKTSAFFRGHQGEAQAFELAPFASGPDKSGRNSGKMGHLLGGWIIPVKWFFVTMDLWICLS